MDKRHFALTIAFICSLFIYAENEIVNPDDIANSDTVKTENTVAVEKHETNIFDQLSEPNEYGSIVIVHQSSAIKRSVLPESTRIMKGFRVQIYSSNKGQKAKTESFDIEQKIKEKISDEYIYVTYLAPFWKVRVGNCQSAEEAAQLRARLVNEFPQYQTQIYVVPDNIIK